MRDDDQDALMEALRPFVERHGPDWVKQAVERALPSKRGRKPGSSPYLDTDSELILEAFYLYQTGRFYGDLDSICKPVKTGYEALLLTAKRFWSERPEWCGNASTPENLVSRLLTRFKKDAVVVENEPIDDGWHSSWPRRRPLPPK
ncbi:MAG: hypothetical protein WBX25_26060 [Rhodomicrobium sp.]